MVDDSKKQIFFIFILFIFCREKNFNDDMSTLTHSHSPTSSKMRISTKAKIEKGCDVLYRSAR